MRPIILIITLTLIVNLGLAQTYLPKDLKKLSHTERLEFAKKAIFPSDNTIYKDTLGNVVRNKNSIDWTESYSDYYVND